MDQRDSGHRIANTSLGTWLIVAGIIVTLGATSLIVYNVFRSEPLDAEFSVPTSLPVALHTATMVQATATPQENQAPAAVASATPTATSDQLATSVIVPPALQAVRFAVPTASPTMESATATPTASMVAVPIPSPTPTLQEPTATPTAPPPPVVEDVGSVVTHVSLPRAGVDTGVVEIGYQLVEIEGQTVIQWDVAEWAAGHHSLTSNPGEGSNVVLAGHVAGYGDVFRNLEYAEIGDEVILTTTDGEYRYQVSEVHLLKEQGVPLEERLAIGAFLEPTPDERLTLITCWPYGVYDHRLIVVAKPLFD